MASEEKQPFLSHLEELRKRLVVCAIGVGAAFVVAYFFSEELFYLLIRPLKRVMPAGERLVFTGLPEMFMTYLKVAFLSGLVVASPLVFYELWMFIAPGLYQKEKQFAVPFVLCSSVLFVGGALFGYFVVFPFGFKFFMSFSNENIQALPSVQQYFSFSLKLLFAFGIVFELPVVIFFLTKMGILTPAQLRKKRKYAALMAFVLGAVLTPPDVISQVLMAVPLLLLYEIGILVSYLAIRKKKAPQAGAAKDGAESPAAQ
jgi:sec-independent protein translocase protein TatC